MPSYLTYADNEEDNESGSVPTRFPEGGFKGTWVNQCFRYMAAVIRDLGNNAAKLPLDSNGVPVTTNAGRLSTLAFQDAANVDITGGEIQGRGYVFLGAIMAYDGTWAGYLAVYDAYFARGWVVCDGRTVTNPYTGVSVTLPDYRAHYLRMFAQTAGAGVKFGADQQTTTAGGARAVGVTGGTALTAANLPIKDGADQELSLGEQEISGVETQVATAHTHTVPAIPDHTHIVDMLPLSVNVIWLKRVW
jgi:hypothetical protein